MSLPKFELSIALEELGVRVAAPSRFFLDDWYDCPTEDWVENVFPAQLAAHLDSVGLHYGGGPENADCDDFALEAWNFARRRHRFTADPKRRSGFAFGVFAYQREDSWLKHMLNVAAICDGFRPNGRGILRMVFFEPMDQRRIVRLTANELMTCESYLF